jgi:pyruvate dehydrogenase E2 component (dihydrolipoamide acetyltransferase)
VLPGNAPEGDAAPSARPPLDATIVMPGDAPYASPAIRAFARELGVDVAQVKGSGRGGRIQREDVSDYVKHALASGARPVVGSASTSVGGLSLLPWPKIDFSKFGEIEEKPLSRIQKISGANLARNWAMIPHVTQHDDADITELEAFRKKLGEENKDLKVTPLVFQIKAVVAALKQFPQFNASLDESGEKLILKKYFHIGIAVDTPDGLVVPVIRDCDKKGLLDLARELGEISKKARDKKLGPAEMSGGCFSISSLGGIGGTGFTPIVNAPEVAILGVSKAAMKPVWNGKEFAPRLILPLSLSYDHRVIDGALAARFAAFLATQLGDIRRLCCSDCAFPLPLGRGLRRSAIPLILACDSSQPSTLRAVRAASDYKGSPHGQHHRNQGSRHRRQRQRAGHRNAGEGRRHRGEGTEPDHAGVGQGDDGDSLQRRRRDQRDQAQGRRRSFRRKRDR